MPSFARTARLAALLAVALALPAAAGAQTPAAIVEDVDSAAAGIEFMDYLSAGRTIRLAAGETLVLGYLASCVREEIAGGTVTIGARQSEVAGGTVARSTTQCAGSRLALAAGQSDKAGGMVFRAPPTRAAASAPPPDLVLYGASPMVETAQPGTLVIERLDAPAPRIEVTLPAGQLVRRPFYDLAKDGRALAPGGTYRATLAGRSVDFAVDAFATPGAGPLVGRLLRFPPS